MTTTNSPVTGRKTISSVQGYVQQPVGLFQESNEPPNPFSFSISYRRLMTSVYIVVCFYLCMNTGVTNSDLYAQK